jgi:ferredoxin
MLVIDPDECIDCALCVPECPIDAIFDEVDLPDDQLNFIKINADLSATWPIIHGMIPAPEDAGEWEDVPGKIQYIEDLLNSDCDN